MRSSAHLLLASLLLPAAAQAASMKLYDVGQGDCILVRCPLYKKEPDAFIVDCSSNKQGAQNYDYIYSDLYAAVFDAKLPTLNGVLITHGDSDHYSKLMRLLDLQWTKSLAIRRFVIGGVDGDYSFDPEEHFGKKSNSNPFYTVVQEPALMLEHNRLAHHYDINQPIGCRSSEPLATLLVSANYGENDSWFKKYDGKRKNARSVALVLRHDNGGGSYTFAWLTGDLTGGAKDYLAGVYSSDKKLGVAAAHNKLQEFLNPPRITDRYTVLKVSHHASREEHSNSWLELVKPDAALISAGLRADYRHPSCEEIEALEKWIVANSRHKRSIYSDRDIYTGMNILNCFRGTDEKATLATVTRVASTSGHSEALGFNLDFDFGTRTVTPCQTAPDMVGYPVLQQDRDAGQVRKMKRAAKRMASADTSDEEDKKPEAPQPPAKKRARTCSPPDDSVKN